MSTARASFLSAPRCISQTVTFAELTASSNGADQTISLNEKLPANAIVLATWINVETLFSGGGASAVTLDVGWSGGAADAEGWYKNQDVFTGAATGIRAIGTGGALGNRVAGANCDVDAAVRTITLNFDPDGGHKLSELTAGSVSFNLIYVIEAANDLILPR